MTSSGTVNVVGIETCLAGSLRRRPSVRQPRHPEPEQENRRRHAQPYWFSSHSGLLDGTAETSRPTGPAGGTRPRCYALGRSSSMLVKRPPPDHSATRRVSSSTRTWRPRRPRPIVQCDNRRLATPLNPLRHRVRSLPDFEGGGRATEFAALYRFCAPCTCQPRAARAFSQTSRRTARGSFDVATEEPVMAGVAGRYASALFDLATEHNKIAEVEKNLVEFPETYGRKSGSGPARPQPGFLCRRPGQGDQGDHREGCHWLSGRQLPAVDRQEPPAVRRSRYDQGVPRPSPRGPVAGSGRGHLGRAADRGPGQRDQVYVARRCPAARISSSIPGSIPRILGGLVVKLGSRMVDSSIRTPALSRSKLA